MRPPERSERGAHDVDGLGAMARQVQRAPGSTPGWRRWLWLVGWLGMIIGACSEPTDRPATTSAPTAPLPPAPRPEALVAELRVDHPDELWAAARSTLRGPFATLPKSFGGLVISVLGMPLGVVGELDPTRPLVAAWMAERTGPGATEAPSAADRHGAPLGWAVAIGLGDSARFLARLRLQAADRFVVEPPTTEGLTWLSRTERGSSWGRLPHAAVALLHGQLLVGSDRQAIGTLGPYLTTASATRDRSKFFEGPSAVAGLASGGGETAALLRIDGDGLHPTLLASLATWLDGIATGRASAYAALLDPEQLRQAASDALGRARAVGARVEVTDGGLRLVGLARLTPIAGGTTRGAQASDLEQLLEAPQDSVVVVGWAETSRGRLDSAKQSTEALMGWLGSPTPDVEPRATDALQAVAKARGDWTAAGLRCTGVGLTGFATASAADPKELDRGLRALLDLRRHPSVAARMKAVGLRLTQRSVRIPDWSRDVVGVRLRTDTSVAKPGAGGPEGERASGGTTPTGRQVARLDPVELFATVGSDRVVLAAGLEPTDTIRRLLEPGEESTLGSFVRPTVFEPGVVGRAPAAGPWAVVAVDPVGLASCLRGMPDGDWGRRVVAAVGPGAEPDLAWIAIEVGAALPAALDP